MGNGTVQPALSPLPLRRPEQGSTTQNPQGPWREGILMGLALNTGLAASNPLHPQSQPRWVGSQCLPPYVSFCK